MIKDHIKNNLVVSLTVLSLAMFGFGYVLVPLYDVFCNITGLRWNTEAREITTQVAEHLTIDYDRLVTVQFDTNVNGNLPWTFKPRDKKLTVHPGEITEAVFVVTNNSSSAITGQAIPSIAPIKATPFFNKTECFCFNQQTLLAKEKKEMVVKFVVGNDLPEKISTLTLSYTFFVLPQQQSAT